MTGVQTCALPILVGGTVLAALVHSLFAVQFIGSLAAAMLSDAPDIRSSELHAVALLSGYLISATLGLIGLARRGLLRCAWALLLMPLYWMLLSLAAWRALFQFIFDPYRWEKTEHGLARTSRLGRALHRKRFKSAAASSGRRFRLNGDTNRPSLSMR